MNPGRMRYRATIMRAYDRTPMGAVSADAYLMTASPGSIDVWCDIKEKESQEKRIGGRVVQTRIFEVLFRLNGNVHQDSRLRLHYGLKPCGGGELVLDCSVVSVISDPRAGWTKVVAAHEVTVPPLANDF